MCKFRVEQPPTSHKVPNGSSVYWSFQTMVNINTLHSNESAASCMGSTKYIAFSSLS